MSNKYERIISIDPGEGAHNGLAISNKFSEGNWDVERNDAVYKAELFDIISRADKPKKLLIIVEEYKLYESKANAMIGNKFETVKVIGVIEYICKQRGIECIISQTMNKAFFNNDRLKKMGLYTAVEHKRDAMRHLLYWLYFTGKELPLDDLV